MRYLFFLLFFFSFMYVYADSVTAQGSNQSFSVLYSQSFNLDKPTTVNCTINSSDGLNLYNATTLIEILLNGSVHSKRSFNQQPSDFQGGSYSAVIPPGVVTVRFSFLLRGGRSCTYSVSLGSFCPSTSQCQSLTCPYCKTTYCSIHSQHYSITFKSDSCKINMHTFCTDNQAAANEYDSAQKTAKCSLCNAYYCKLCGHTCSSLNEGCPNLKDCLPKSCATCKSIYCETHSFHLCSPVGNNNNNSGGSWSVWTEQVGTTENVNVQADFTPLVNAQNNANTLLNNIKSSLPGFVTEINNTINNVDSTLKDKINPNLDDMRTHLGNISSNIQDTINPRLSDMLIHTNDIANNTGYIATEFVKVLDNLSNISDKSNTIDSSLTNTVNQLVNLNTLITQSNSTASDQLTSTNNINAKLTVANANLSSLSTYASSTNSNIQMMKQILSDEIVVSLRNHLDELKKQSELQKQDFAIQDAIKKFLIDNVHPVLKDTKEFQSLIRSDLSLLAADLSKMKSNSDTTVEHIVLLKSNSDQVKSNTDHLLNNSNFIRNDVSDIKQNTDSIKETASGIKQNTDSIKETASGIKQNTDSIKEDTKGIKDDTKEIKDKTKEIKDDTKGINDKLEAQGQTLDEINTALNPSATYLPPQTIVSPGVAPASKYTAVDTSNSNIDHTELDTKLQSYKEKLETLPQISIPSYKPLTLTVPLSTSFFDFTFSLDLNGGPHADTISSIKTISYSIFSCFWVLLFTFLFIKCLRQW